MGSLCDLFPLSGGTHHAAQTGQRQRGDGKPQRKVSDPEAEMVLEAHKVSEWKGLFEYLNSSLPSTVSCPKETHKI